MRRLVFFFFLSFLQSPDRSNNDGIRGSSSAKFISRYRRRLTSSPRRAAFYVRDHRRDSHCPRHGRAGRRNSSIDPSSSVYHALLIQTSRRPFSRARLESGSAISKYLLAGRVNRERIGERARGRWHRINPWDVEVFRIVESIPDVSVSDWADKCFSTLNIFSTNESGP